jgi:hypothetical protein
MTENGPAVKIDYAAKDARYWEQLEVVIAEQGLTLRDVLRYFPTYVRRRELARFLAHYELFKQVVDLPGCILEVGVFRGASFFTWAELLETFCPCDRHRLVYGFDHFEGLVHFVEADGQLDEADRDQDRARFVHALASSAGAMRKLVELHNDDNLLPGMARCHLVEGDVMRTIPQFVEENPGVRISLLHLDADLYEPTKVALEHLYPLIAKGGIVVLDEYGLQAWPGESRAVDEFISGLPEPPVIKRFHTTCTPGGYFVK